MTVGRCYDIEQTYQSVWETHVYYNLPLAEGNLFVLFKLTLKCPYSNYLTHVFLIKCLLQVACFRGDSLLRGVILSLFFA